MYLIAPNDSIIRKTIITLAMIGLLWLIAARLLLFVGLQLPAPVGDGILFLSVSHYHCTEGVFRSPIFPIDSVDGRYIWHAIAQPALISLLNFDCSNAGNFISLSILLVATFALSIYSARYFKNKWLGLIFGLVIFALQVKQGFRPEVLAITLVLGCELLLHRRNYFFVAPLATLAWTHPVAFIIYGLYVLVLHWDSLIRDYRKEVIRIVIVAAFVNVVFLVLYPFPITDHFFGLVEQAKKVAGSGWGDLETYFVRSHFFPLFGFVFFAVYLAIAIRRLRLLMLFLPIWWFWLRSPALVYNVMPLFCAMLFQLFISLGENGSLKNPNVLHKLKDLLPKMVVVFSLMSAAIGLAQGIARDAISHLKFQSSLDSAQIEFNQLMKEEINVCAVPPFFTLFLPSALFEKSFGAKLKQCDSVKRKQISLHVASGRPELGAGCRSSHAATPTGFLDSFFRSDSGYSFQICEESR